MSFFKKCCKRGADVKDVEHGTTPGRPQFILTPSNFISRWLMLWVFKLVAKTRSSKVNVTELGLTLYETETTAHNDNVITAAYQKLAKVNEKLGQNKNLKKPPLIKVLLVAYLKCFMLTGIWKIIWGISLWFGAYWLLKQTIKWVRDANLSKTANATEFTKWNDGYGYAVGFLISSIICSIAIQQLIVQGGRLGLQVRAGLMSHIYRKALVLARIKGGAGDIVNLVSNDCQRIADACTNLHYLWSSWIEVIVILALSFVELKKSAFPALGIILLLFPLQIYLARLKSRTGLEYTLTTSKRVHIMSEILTAIKLIKFYAWEEAFTKRVDEIRTKELRLLRRNMFANAVNFAIVFNVPVLVALFSLIMFWKIDGNINPIIGFTVVSVFNTLRYPLLMLPLAINSFSDARIALQRLEEFFAEEEIEPTVRHAMPTDSDEIISMIDASFAWIAASDAEPTLKNLTWKANRRQLVAIVGDVGSGKTSILSALLRQMIQIGDSENIIKGSISYVPQEPWLLNMTLRDNILFGKEYNEQVYNKVIKVCALERDISLMTHKDQTEIGERGVNLSGGQRQRVGIARAVYNFGDVFLLDDPLSALDQQVGRKIWDECIKSYLKEKTIIFVTNQLQYLPQVDLVLVIRNGRIVEQGLYTDLISNEDGVLTKLVGSKQSEVDEHNEDDYDNEAIDELSDIDLGYQSDAADKNSDKDQEKPRFAKQERHASHVNFELSPQDEVQRFKHRIAFGRSKSHAEPFENKNKYITLNKKFSTANLTLNQARERRKMSIVNNIVANDVNIVKHIEIANQQTFIDRSLSKMSVVSVVVDYQPEENLKLVVEDQSVHYKKSPYLSYLQANPGVAITLAVFIFFFMVHLLRILSDYWISLWFARSTGKYTFISNDTFVTVYGIAVFLFTAGVLTRGLVFACLTFRKNTILHRKMFNSVIAAPMSFYDSTPIGRTLNAFARHMYATDDQLSDALMQALQYLPLTLGAICLTIGVLPITAAVFGSALALGILLLIFAGKSQSNLQHQESISKSPIFSNLTASLDGLFSIRAFQVQDRFVTLNQANIDKNHLYYHAMISVKCWVALYLDVLTSLTIFFVVLIIGNNPFRAQPSVVGIVLSNVLQLLVFLQWSVRMVGEINTRMSSVHQVAFYGNKVEPEAARIIEDSRPPPDWPSSGNITFSKVELRYQQFGVAVLKDVTLQINAGEKIGIVGRTGSGKSTLLISLLRIVELTKGDIIVDDIDIAEIGLFDLRSKIAIIPQEPILFVGTVRENIDPFNNSTDQEIWKVLDDVNLSTFIKSMQNGGLQAAVIENGKNFSVGQRQLFCIARAILSKAQIVVLDEATAAVDLQTDQLIQNCIKSYFRDRTVLTIAHRLNTIIESDRILVMDAGHVVEFSEPLTLLANEDGFFSNLVAQTGADSARELRLDAERHARSNENFERK